MNDVKKCSKCGSDSIKKKDVWFMGSWGSLNRLYATAYLCVKCGYIELYGEV